MSNLLIVGAKEGSLGAAIYDRAVLDNSGPVTAGVSGEHLFLDVNDYTACRDLFKTRNFRNVVCTVGVNRETSVFEYWADQLVGDWMINCAGPLFLLQQWVAQGQPDNMGHFVFISSNSAQIPRSTSASYCASKAYLSMAVRCVAREVAGYKGDLSIYAYEFGWLNDTPMSKEVLARLPDGVAPHRIPGGQGMDKHEMADIIFRNIFCTTTSNLNGCVLRIDGGEL